MKLTLKQKMWLVIALFILTTLCFAYGLSNYFYKTYYVQNVESRLTDEGMRLAYDYEEQGLTPQFEQRVNWYGEISEAEVVLVSNPRDLSACLPFDIDYDTIISEADREQLLSGQPLTKTGYETRFDRQIMGVVIPLLDEKRLEGIIYLYMPLTSVTDMLQEVTMIWGLAAAFFTMIALWLGGKLVVQMTKPLRVLEEATIRMAEGNYKERVPVQVNDEIGRLSMAFNEMAEAIDVEDERKKQFLATVSHELRTPLSYVKGYSEAMLEGVADPQHMAIIHREAGRMERLVNDLLDLAKLDGDQLTLNKQPLSFAQLIEDSAHSLYPAYAQKGLTVELQLDDEIIIEADQDRLEQVVQNVLTNALRYTEVGGVTLTLVARQDDCQLTIVDTGIGVAAEQVSRLGERFFRANEARTRKDGGTGLGLSISKKIVELHGGTMSFASDRDKGMTVVMTLPMLEL